MAIHFVLRFLRLDVFVCQERMLSLLNVTRSTLRINMTKSTPAERNWAIPSILIVAGFSLLSHATPTMSMDIVIKPYGGGYKNAWRFDGETLRPYSGGYDNSWRFDGKTLTPYRGGYRNAWQFDGRVLRRYSGGYSDAWTFEKGVLKPYSGAYSQAWLYDGKVFKPYSGGYSNAWTSEQSVPIPIMAKAAGII